MNKKCPLCDEPAVISHELTTTNVVYCGNPACPCNWHGMTEEVWNHRPEEERLQARIAELEAALAVEREANRWISVEERLPDRPGKYLWAWRRTSQMIFDISYYEPVWGAVHSTITHWRPIEPPKEGEG